MEDTWLSVEDDSNSSFADSDAIDSETEAELYSVIHYEQNLHNINCPRTETENVHTSDETKNVSFTEESREFLMTKSLCRSSPVSMNVDESSVKNTSNYETVSFNKVPQNLKLMKKEKSGDSAKCNVSSIISEDIYVNHTVKDALSNNNKRKTDFDSSVSSSAAKKNFMVINDSSDSDSIIWTEVDVSDKKEFQTNLYEDDNDDVIYYSSESESHFNCLPPSRKNERNLQNISMPNIKIGESVKDLWFVNEQDLRRAKKNKSRRYHDNAENTCSNCFGKGHSHRICPMPKNIKCFICGGAGHPGSICANRICGRCFSSGHDSKRCWMPIFTYCILCNMKGHIKENCPDLWRRYHLTTDPGKIVHGKRIKHNCSPYCWNCGESGHIGSVCKESRGSKHCLPTWPCVVSYDDPEDLLKERLNSHCDQRKSFKRNTHLNQMNVAVKRNTHLNQMNGAVSTNVTLGKNRKKKNRLNQQKNKMKQALREKDFPRTPKNNQSSFSDDPLPESVTKMLTKKQRRKEKNRKRRLKKRLELLAEKNARKNSLQTKM